MGSVVAGATGDHAPISSPQPLWAEQDPADWWQATTVAVRQALAAARLDGAAIQGIGLSGQMHGVVLLDKTARGAAPQPDLVRPAQPGAVRLDSQTRWGASARSS